MKAKKVMVTVLAAAALVTGSVFGTMAYLTDSESVTNTFTVGKVGITLDEVVTDEYGVAPDADDRTDEGNAYKLIPGQKYTKDPTIHVDDNSEDSWLFVKVENGITDIEKASNTIHSQMVNGDWVVLDEDNGVYAYNRVVAGGEDIIVFNTFEIDGAKVVNSDTPAVGEYNIDNYATAAAEGNIIKVTAYAVQKAGFDTAADAWGETFAD